MSDTIGISTDQRNKAAARAQKAQGARPVAKDDWIKVASFNVNSGNTAAQVIADLQRFLLNSDADIIGLQEALGVFASLPAAFPAYTFVAPVTSTLPDDGTPDDSVPRTKDIPIMVKKATCKILNTNCFLGASSTGGDDAGTAEGSMDTTGNDDGVVPTGNTSVDANQAAWPVVIVRVVHNLSQQVVKVYNGKAPRAEDLDLYRSYTHRLVKDINSTPRGTIVFAMGDWQVDYRDRNLKVAEWPMLALGRAKMASNWSFGATSALPASTVKVTDGTSLQDQVYARVSGSLAFVQDFLGSTTYSDHYALLTTYALTKVSNAPSTTPPTDPSDPDGDDSDDDPQPVTTPKTMPLTLVTLALSSGTLSNAQTDVAAVDDAVSGADIFGFQDVAKRNGIFSGEGLNSYREVSNDYVGVSSRKQRFKQVSRAYVPFITKDDPGGYLLGDYPDSNQYAGAWETVLKDVKTARVLRVWSLSIPSANSGYEVISNRAFAAISKQARQTPRDQAFIVMAKSTQDAKAQGDESVAGHFDTAGMSTNWSRLGYAAGGTISSGDHVDYIAITDRPWIKWKTQSVVGSLHSSHKGLSATLTVKPDSTPTPVTPGGHQHPSNDPPPDTSPTGLTKTSYVITIATANIKHDMTDANITTAASISASVCDVLCTQELSDPRNHNLVRAASPAFTWKFYSRQEDIGFRTAKMQLAASGVMPSGIANQGSIFVHGSYHVVTPARFINWLALVPVAHPNTKPLVVMDTHFVAGGFNANTHQAYEAWRVEHWYIHYQKMQDLIAKFMSAGLSVVYMGDFNRMGTKAFPRTHWLYSRGIDKIGLGEAHNGVGVTLLGQGDRHTPSDHPVHFVKVRVDT